LNKIEAKGTLSKVFYTLSIVLVIAPILSHFTSYSDSYWIFITKLGDETFYVALLPIVYLLISRELGFKLILLFMTSAWINVTLKAILAMPRPPQELWKVEASGYGFPSGHAQSSTVFWGYLSYKVRIRAFILFATLMVLLIAYSRVYLGVHYPHDVAGGIIIGLALILISHIIEHRLSHHFMKTHYSFKILMLFFYSLFVLLLLLVVKDLIIVKIAGLILGGGLGHIIVNEKYGIREISSFKIRATMTIMGEMLVFICYMLVRKVLNPLILYLGFMVLGLIITFTPLLVVLLFKKIGSSG